jgi:hypothetical protein
MRGRLSVLAQLGERRRVLPIVEHHIDEAVANLARRDQRATVMAIAKELSVTALQPVHLLRDAREEKLHRTRSAGTFVGFDHEVQVIVLDRVVKNADTAPNGVRDLSFDRADDTL